MARRQRRSKRVVRGGGYRTGLDFVSPGYPVIHQYSGVGKDCPADMPHSRFGFIPSLPAKGLPGMSGGARLGVAEDLPYGPVGPSIPIAAPVPSASAVQQKGGAYSTLLSPLNPSNGVGASALPSTQTIPCSLRYPSTMRGGSSFPRVEVGAADMMTYHAQNAGYTNRAVTVPGGAVPAIMAQVGYPAGAFNRACLTTGGGLEDSAPVTPATNLGNRFDFDGTTGSLPVKYGGGRRMRKTHARKTHARKTHARKTHKNRNARKNAKRRA